MSEHGTARAAMGAAHDIPPPRLRRLRLFNLGMGVLHALQGVLVLALATDFSLPVTATFMQGPPGSAPAPRTVLFSVNIAWGVALFLFMSAIAHLTIASPGVSDRYGRGLAAATTTRDGSSTRSAPR